MNDSILIIMPAYNASAFIKQAIQSIINQNYTNWYLIIVDDASTDNTRNIINEYKNNPKIKIYYNNVNVGPYQIRNFVLQKYASKYDFWITHDADDISIQSRLQKLIFNLKKTHSDIISSAMYFINEKTKTPSKLIKSTECTYLFSKKVFETVGYFNKSYFGSDTEYIKRIKLLKFKHTILPNILLYANDNKNRIMRNINKTDRYNFIRKINLTLNNMQKENNAYLDFNVKYKISNNKIIWPTTIKEIQNKKETDKILVIMSAYNSEKFIAMSIESVLKQQYKNFILAIVDDASTDNTYNIIQEYSNKDNRIFIYHLDENKGSYYARNVALKYHIKDCDYWTLHDADDYMYENKLKEQIINIGDKPGINCLYKRKNFYTKKIILKSSSYNGWLYSKQVFNDLGYYDSNTRFGGDSEYMNRFLSYYKLNKASLILNKILFTAYLHSTNQTIKVPIHSKERITYIKKYKEEISKGLYYKDFNEHINIQIYNKNKLKNNKFKYTHTYIFNQFFGIGDILFIEPIMRQYFIEGNNIILPVLEKYLNLQPYFPYIKIIDKEKLNIDYEEQKIIKKDNITILPIRWSREFFNSELSYTMKNKYKMVNIDINKFRDLTWLRHRHKEQELINYLNIKPNEKYNLINENFHTYLNNHREIKVNNSYRNIEMNFIDGFTLLDWTSIIENAEEIHTVNTSILFLLESLNLNASQIHLYSRNINGTDFKQTEYLYSKNYVKHK